MKEKMVDVLDAFVDSKLQGVHTAIPGSIVAYDKTQRKAVVKPLITMKTRNDEDVIIPPIQNVPVIFPSSSSFSLVFPLLPGDGCLILFSETGIGNFLNSQGQEVLADDVTRFSLTDAICLPGLFPFSVSAKKVSEQNKIEIDELGQMKIFTGTQSFVKGEVLEGLLNTFLSAIEAIVPGSPGQNATALTAIKTASTILNSSLSTIKSTTIKGE